MTTLAEELEAQLTPDPDRPLSERSHGRLLFGESRERWQICDPQSDELRESMHACRYGSPTRVDLLRVLGAAEDYLHLTTYALGQEHCVEKLRHIWRTLRGGQKR